MYQQFKNNKFSALLVHTEHKSFVKNKNTKGAPAPYSGVFSMMREEIWATHQAAQVHLPHALTLLLCPACESVVPKEAQAKIIQSKLDDLYEGKRDLQGLIESLKEEKRALLGVPEKRSKRANMNSFASRANQGASCPSLIFNPQ